MAENTETQMESLPDLDDLLQCPVCYEIPTGQIFQCNEGHHVCGRCKMRLDVCPVCRAFFFGTRNYAMEELIANVRKLRAFKLGGKVTTGSPPAVVAAESVSPRESSSDEEEPTNENGNNNDETNERITRLPCSCKGLFRCLCCKENPERLPLGRLINHLRYYHSPDLIESRSENGAYLQAWQFPTTPGRIVTAIRIHNMGIFFLVLEVTFESAYAWLSMAASPWVANEFSYSFTLTGNDREAIFTDCVYSVRACEGSLKSRNRCLKLTGADARSLLMPVTVSGKLVVRRTPRDMQVAITEPRVMMRVANRSRPNNIGDVAGEVALELEPFLQDLQDDVARLSRAFATLGREANALVRSEAEMRARLESPGTLAIEPSPAMVIVEVQDDASPRVEEPLSAPGGERRMSRSARRRLRQRLRDALGANLPSNPSATEGPGASGRAPIIAPRPFLNGTFLNDLPPQRRTARNGSLTDVARRGLIENVISRPQNQLSNNAASSAARVAQPPISVTPLYAPVRPPGHIQNSGMPRDSALTLNGPPAIITPRIHQNRDTPTVISELAARGFEVVSGPRPPVPPPTFDGPSQGPPTNGNVRNKKKRRQRR